MSDRWDTLRRLGACEAHVVQSGDSLSAIARSHGLTWRRLYNHPCNRELRAKRPNPDYIFPGDIVYLPRSNPA